MYRLFKVGLVVAAAFSFTILMMYVGGWRTGPKAVSYFCAYLMLPGMVITVDWLHMPLHGGNFFPLSLTFNTLIYSVLFGLLFKLLGFIRRRHKSEG
jgi:apolipoprotein N-acyltransferase